jgi:hypothetical protein
MGSDTGGLEGLPGERSRGVASEARGRADPAHLQAPSGRACKVVTEQMREEMSYAYISKQVPAGRIFDWEMRLSHSMDVSWQDLPPNHPKRMVDWRR